MSICIISGHIIYAKTKFHYNLQHIDQVKPKVKGGPIAHPLDPPLHATVEWIYRHSDCAITIATHDGLPLLLPTFAVVPSLTWCVFT